MTAQRVTKTRRPGAACVPALACAVVLAACAGGATAQLAARPLVPGIVPKVRPTASTGDLSKTLPLLHVDDELGGYLNQAEELIEKEQYDRAIQMLQALIGHGESGFFQEADGRFVSLRLKAAELIGQMGPKGLKLYRALYDPQGQRLYEEAMKSSQPERLLRKLSERYLHTTYGPRALESLAALYFDRARFPQAGACWRQLLELTSDAGRRAALLAKAAAAHHLSGETAAARRAIDELRKKHPGATAPLGGRQQNLAQFIQRVQRLPVLFRGGGKQQVGWPGLGGLPDAVATMSDCNVVLAPRWRRSDEKIEPGADLLPKLLAGGTMYLSNTGMPNVYSSFSRSSNVRRTVRMKQGHLVVQSRVGNNAQGESPLPGMIHPVVVGRHVITRLEDKVVAFDLLTGERAWETVESLPMVHRPKPTSGSRRYYYGGYSYIGDAGRYALTVGEGKVFAVYSFLAMGNHRYYGPMPRANNQDGADSSMLAAVSVESEGKLIWRIGRGRGDDDVVRNGLFLCPPAYRGGRLYATALYLERYYLLCLDAESGSLLWQAPVAQTPAIRSGTGRFVTTDPRLTIGASPTVVDGRIFVTTNAGVIAAFEEETGQPLWGYQYDSTVHRTGVTSVTSRYQMAVHMPTNPLIVSRGKLICLPADSASLIALDAATGRPAWQQSRRGQRHLSAVDADRVLLCGQGLHVLKVADGSDLYRSEELGIKGRPAVTPTAVLASAEAKIHVLDLKTYKLSDKGLTAADGFLGNLVSARGKLIAANMLGVCTYFSFDSAYAELSDRLKEMPAEQRPPVLLKRAQLAFDARRFDEALADLKRCQKEATAAGDVHTLPQLPQRFYLTYVAMANRAGDDQVMHERLLAAQSQARTRQEKAHMLFRLALWNERVDQYAEAAALAQQIGEVYADEELVEVEIGPDAAEDIRFGPSRRTVTGRKLAEDYIQGLLEKYGRECYAAFDAKAKAELDKVTAGRDLDGVLAVARRWPNSRWTDRALFAAAEMYYRRSKSGEKTADVDLAECRRHLNRVVHMAGSSLRVSARTALATIYTRGGWPTMARKEIEALRDESPDVKVAFADVTGTLGEVLERIEASKLPPAIRRMRHVSRIRPPVQKAFTIKGADVFILRDQELRPIRIGRRLAVVVGSDVHLVDTAATSLEEAIAEWKGLADVDKAGQIKYAYYTPGMRLVGGLSADGKVLAVADRKKVRGLDVMTAKVLWQKEMAAIGVPSFYCMGSGEGVVVVADRGGKVSCLDVATGGLLWQNNLISTRRNPVGPPRIGAGLVIFRHDNGRAVTAFDLKRGGRVKEKWKATQWTQVELTADGMLLLLADGKLTALDRDRLDKPLWERTYSATNYPVILGASSEYVAFSRAQNDPSVEVLTLSGGRPVATVQTAASHGAAAIPVDAKFADGQLYVMCTPSLSGRRKYSYGRQTNCRGLSIQKFDVASERRLWARDVEDSVQYYPNVLPMTLGSDHVVVTARQYQQVGLPYYAFILSGRDGKVVQKISLHGGGAGANESRRRQGIGAAVMTNGKLCVESSEGVTVYGER